MQAQLGGGEDSHLGDPLECSLPALRASVPEALRRRAAEAAGAGRRAICRSAALCMRECGSGGRWA